MRGILIISLFPMWKLRIREVRELAQSHTACQKWSWIPSQTEPESCNWPSSSRPHHCAFSGFHRTSPVHLPPPAHSPGPACITVIDAHTSRVLFQSRSFLGAKPLCFPCTVSRSEKILIKYLDEKGAHFSTFSITHFQLMPSLLRSVK